MRDRYPVVSRHASGVRTVPCRPGLDDAGMTPNPQGENSAPSLRVVRRGTLHRSRVDRRCRLTC